MLANALCLHPLKAKRRSKGNTLVYQGLACQCVLQGCVTGVEQAVCLLLQCLCTCPESKQKKEGIELILSVEHSQFRHCRCVAMQPIAGDYDEGTAFPVAQDLAWI